MASSSLSSEVLKIEDEIIQTYKTIHQNPELSFEEKKTAKLVADRLKSLGIEVKTGVAGTGVIGLLKGEKPGKVIGLRADMDALPMEEEVEWEYKSKVKGVCHSCGHDTHVAMLLGAATLLAKHRDELHGTVKFIFQPAEELVGPNGSGAKLLVEAGVLENPKVDLIVGVHIVGSLPSKTFGLKPGPMGAHADPFWITITGRGSHQVTHNLAIDPVFIAVQVVNALQGVPNRMIDPRKPFVFSIQAINSGTKTNIIPDVATLAGGIRSPDEESHKKSLKYLNQITKSICEGFGATCKIESRHGSPLGWSDPKLVKKMSTALSKIPGTKVHIETEPDLGSEDFRWYQQVVPGAMFSVGTKNKAKGLLEFNHSSKFRADPDVLKYGTVAFATLALELSR